MSHREYDIEYCYEAVPLQKLNEFLERECRQRYIHGDKANVPWEVHTVQFEGGFARLLLKRVS